MTKDDNKVQAYVSEKTKAFLIRKAEEEGIRTSKYIAQVLTNHVEEEGKSKAYKARVINILGYIFSCVYDKDACENNSQETQKILEYIKQECNKNFLIS